MKVYVLITEYAYDNGNRSTDCEVFEDLAQAKTAMKEKYHEWLLCEQNHCLPDGWVEDITDHSIEIWEEGEYINNHCNWWIMERGVL